jgi:hypothetical protein
MRRLAERLRPRAHSDRAISPPEPASEVKIDRPGKADLPDGQTSALVTAPDGRRLLLVKRPRPGPAGRFAWRARQLRRKARKAQARTTGAQTPRAVAVKLPDLRATGAALRKGWDATAQELESALRSFDAEVASYTRRIAAVARSGGRVAPASDIRATLPNVRALLAGRLARAQSFAESVGKGLSLPMARAMAALRMKSERGRQRAGRSS